MFSPDGRFIADESGVWEVYVQRVLYIGITNNWNPSRR